MTLGFRAYPAYTTVEAVRAEIPPRTSEADFPDETIALYINTGANRIDGELSRYYALPAPALPAPGGDPSLLFVPVQLEVINRYLAVAEALVSIRDTRGDEASNKSWFEQQAEKMLDDLKEGRVLLTYPFLNADGKPQFVPLAAGSPLYGKHPLSAGRRVASSFPERTFTRESTARWHK